MVSLISSTSTHSCEQNSHTKPRLGDVLRSGPNTLSFANITAYRDIYGHVKHGQKRFLKNEWYDPKFDATHQEPRIVRVRDPVIHGEQRKALSHAFSARALRDQEEVVHHYVDLLMQQFKNLGQSGQKPINASLAWNWLTFDVIGKASCFFSSCLFPLPLFNRMLCCHSHHSLSQMSSIFFYLEQWPFI